MAAKIVKIDKIGLFEYMTVAEAAEITGIEKQSVRDKLFRGQWVTYKFGHLTLLATAEIELFLKNRGGLTKG